MASSAPVVDGSVNHGDVSSGGIIDRIEASTRKVVNDIKGNWRAGHHLRAVGEVVVAPQEMTEHVVASYAVDAGHAVVTTAKKALPVINEEVLIFGGLALAAGFIFVSGLKQVNNFADKII